MPAPAITGQLRDKISDMEIGDYIAMKYNATTTKYEFGGSLNGYTEVPITGNPWSGVTLPDRYWYMIKVDIGILISDRIAHHSVSWDRLNELKFIQGLPLIVSDITGILRSLTGGVAYADKNGNRSNTDQGYGAWPTHNEWDKYIINFPTSRIQTGKTLDDVFHVGPTSFCQETLLISVVNGDGVTATTSTLRSRRKNYLDIRTGLFANESNWSGTSGGFRPVFEYKEV